MPGRCCRSKFSNINTTLCVCHWMHLHTFVHIPDPSQIIKSGLLQITQMVGLLTESWHMNLSHAYIYILRNKGGLMTAKRRKIPYCLCFGKPFFFWLIAAIFHVALERSWISTLLWGETFKQREMKSTSDEQKVS